MLLGEFLIQEGLVTSEALNKALERQTRDQIPLGQLAVQKGFLSNEKVHQILTIQRKAQDGSGKFGKVALEEGLLTQEKLNQLLNEQSEKTELLGNILVDEKALAPLQLMKALKKHNALKNSQ